MAFQQRGIDVSAWQGDIDWKKVGFDGIKFAIIRAAVANNADKKFIKNIEEAASAGLPCGIYLYSLAKTPDEAKREADFVLKLIKPYKLIYPVAYDIEDNIQQKLDTAARTKLVKAFCEPVLNEGYRTAVYSSLSWFNNMLDLTQLTGYYNWVAQWGVDKCSFKGPLHIWQSSNKGRINGIDGDVDLNVCYYDYVAQQASDTQNQQKEYAAGEAVKLLKTDIFKSSLAKQPAGQLSGTYWIYDGLNLNGRLRITSSKNRVGKKPLVENVTAYVDAKALKRADG